MFYLNILSLQIFFWFVLFIGMHISWEAALKSARNNTFFFFKQIIMQTEFHRQWLYPCKEKHVLITGPRILEMLIWHEKTANLFTTPPPPHIYLSCSIMMFPRQHFITSVQLLCVWNKLTFTSCSSVNHSTVPVALPSEELIYRRRTFRHLCVCGMAITGTKG